MHSFLHRSVILLFIFFSGRLSMASSQTISHDNYQGKAETKQQNHQKINLNYSKTIIKRQHGRMTKITCFDRNGKPRNFIIQGDIEGTVIVKCSSDADNNPHLYLNKDGAVREIGVTKITGDAENLFVINRNAIGKDTEITIEGTNTKFSYGNVEINGRDNSDVINTTTMNGKIYVKGGGSNVNIGSVTIGN